jgi:hypothetical protein
MLTFDICNFINFIFHWINTLSSILSFMKLMNFFSSLDQIIFPQTIDKYIISMLFNNEKVKTINVKTNDVCKIKWKEIENSRFFVTTLLSDKIQVKIK